MYVEYGYDHFLISGSGNLYERLKSDGVIHEASMYSLPHKKYVTLEVFDFDKCDGSVVSFLDEHVKKRLNSLHSYFDKNDDLSEEYKKEVFSELEKVDPHLIPVSRGLDGCVCWGSNRVDELPAVAISSLYPEERFSYEVGKSFECCIRDGFVQNGVYYDGVSNKAEKLFEELSFDKPVVNEVSKSDDSVELDLSEVGNRKTSGKNKGKEM